MQAAILFLLLAPRLQPGDISEMGCTGENCVTIAQLAAMPTDQLPEGCQLEMRPVTGTVSTTVPILTCGKSVAAAVVPNRGVKLKRNSSLERIECARFINVLFHIQGFGEPAIP